jgi:hypothetical protein
MRKDKSKLKNKKSKINKKQNRSIRILALVRAAISSITVMSRCLKRKLYKEEKAL